MTIVPFIYQFQYILLLRSDKFCDGIHPPKAKAAAATDDRLGNGILRTLHRFW
jgi:hypothetical protein